MVKLTFLQPTQKVLSEFNAALSEGDLAVRPSPRLYRSPNLPAKPQTLAGGAALHVRKTRD